MTLKTLLLALAFALPASGAFAHAHLQSAVPPVGSTIEQAPEALTLNFTEALEPRFCSVEVTDEKGARVDAGAVHTDPGDGKRLIAPLKQLMPGIYKVQWHATSVDTHRTEGDFRFTVK